MRPKQIYEQKTLIKKNKNVYMIECTIFESNKKQPKKKKKKQHKYINGEKTFIILKMPFKYAVFNSYP